MAENESPNVVELKPTTTAGTLPRVKSKTSVKSKTRTERVRRFRSAHRARTGRRSCRGRSRRRRGGANIVADLDKRIAQIDAAIDKATRRGRTNGAMSLAADQRKTQAELVITRTKEAKTLAGLQVKRTGIDGERKTVEADTGPVRYLAQLIGATDEATMRYFILVVAALLDPAAVLLLLAATGTSMKAAK